MIDDTIAAVATAVGEAGLAVIRVSGPESFAIAGRCFRPLGPQKISLPDVPSHTVHYGKIFRRNRAVDEVLVSVLRAPRTYTREDVVEISCHGGTVPTKAVLETLLEQGARLAEPGEFTRRAFLNGRIDLTQAEAVADVIRAKTDLALVAANEQLAGKLSRRIESLRNELLAVLAHLEAHIDFPEEDIAPDDQTEMTGKIRRAIQSMDRLLVSATEGKILRHGIRAVIVGRPNAGKSSLLNCLLDQDRAIVSRVAGTTRDTIEETANIRGIPVVFVDTAGLRTSGDAVEREGMRRSLESAAKADLIIMVVDVTRVADPEEAELTRQLNSAVRFTILNKIDLLDSGSEGSDRVRSRPDVLPVSCLTGEGIETLKDAISEKVWQGGLAGGRAEVAINRRHQHALERARKASKTALDSLTAGRTLELVALDLRIATDAVGEIVGKTSTDDLLDLIFREFCLGK